MSSYYIPRPTVPKALQSSASTAQKYEYQFQNYLYKKRLSIYAKLLETLEENMGKSYSILWGNCKEKIKARLRSSTNYRNILSKTDLVVVRDEEEKSLRIVLSKNILLGILGTKRYFLFLLVVWDFFHIILGRRKFVNLFPDF